MNAKGLTALVLILIAGICSAEVTVENLRCEYLENPLGIDVLKPRLSWITESNQRGWMQSEYQILVASSEEKLKQNKGDLWNSGRVQSDRSIHVAYDGMPLTSRALCYWKVRVWDNNDKASAWSKPALWSMGLLEESDWQGAKWIGLDPKPKPEKPKKDEYFVFKLAEGKAQIIDHVVLYNFGGTDNSYYSKDFSVQVSDATTDKPDFKKVLSGTLKRDTNPQTYRFEPVKARYVKLLIHSGYRSDGTVELGEFEAYTPQGKNVIAASQGAKILEFNSQHNKKGDWSAERINDGTMTGMSGSWCSGSEKTGEHTRLPARYLRREFVLDKPVERATAYFCGLGESELYLNGQKVGNHERDPGMTMFSKRCLYVTFEIKDLIKQGVNSVGAILGNGRFFAPRVRRPVPFKNFGVPRMILVMRVEYSDGTIQEIVSDESWKVTDQGPIRANNEYDGEEYDARMEMPGWDRPGFNDSRWDKAQLLAAPGGRLVARMYEPMRITETFKPEKITNQDPGVYIVHFEKGFYGTVRLNVSGPVGTKIVMRSAFDLHPDGRFKAENNRSAKISDIYILKGSGKETWRPRFRGQGTRYVEVTGFPGVPKLENFEGLFMHDDMEETGRFECSNRLINQINRLMRYDQMGQKQSHPKELERDERMGWLGGSGTYVVDEAVHMNTAAFYAKWMADTRLDQNVDGSISDVCPAYWNFRSGSLVWPADLILIPQAMHEYYGDRRVLEENYEAMKKWVTYTLPLQKSDMTVDHDRYGDHCAIVPTPKPLIGTTYFYNNAMQLSKIAGLLGKTDDQRRFADLAKKTGEAFNKRFFDPATNTFASKTQCSYLLPLAFGLVPKDHRQAVIDNLVHDIMVTQKKHVTVGLVGMLYYMRTLTNICDRADVAYALITQTDKPSWGYMIDKDASGMWELWDHDTAGPGMNGSGFLMLTGDINAWFYQALAGINPDPRQPGFKHIVLKPQPVGDLTYVNASYKSMHGRIVSNWKREGDTFRWQVTVPANTTATVYVPAKDATGVTESGKPAGETDSVRFIRMQDSRAVFEAGSGNYEFRSTMK